MKTFDWIIVGGGIAGISLSEILTREGHSVALIEKKINWHPLLLENFMNGSTQDLYILYLKMI